MEVNNVFKTSSVKEILDLLNQYSEEARIIAGGTDIMIQLREGKLNASTIIDISSVDEMQFINDNGDYVEIGAAVSFTKLYTNSIIINEFKGLSDAAHMVGSPQIRNKGTVGGNIANGSPAADTVPPLIALGAVCVIKSLNGEREVELKNFHTGKGKVDLAPNELLYSIKVKKLGVHGGVGFSKLGLRNALAISRLSVAVSLKVENNICTDCKIGAGSLSRAPEREEKIESLLIGKEVNDTTISEVAEAYGDYIAERLKGRSAMEFKSEAVKGSFKDAARKALSEIK